MSDHPTDALAAYALGELDRETAEDVLAHADQCPACAEALADAIRGVHALAASGDAAEDPRPAAVARRRPSAWLVTAAAAALALFAWNLDLRASLAPPPVDALVHSHFTHHPLAGQGGDAKLIVALDGSWVYLVADGLRPFGSYHLTIDGADVGDVRADVRGEASGYWSRSPSRMRSAALDGAGTHLTWNDR